MRSVGAFYSVIHVAKERTFTILPRVIPSKHVVELELYAMDEITRIRSKVRVNEEDTLVERPERANSNGHAGLVSRVLLRS